MTGHTHRALAAARRPTAGVRRRMSKSKPVHHVLMKVETHNHPTAISPYPGAATGAGGEIRDEGATGRGAKPKAGCDGLHRQPPAPAWPGRVLGAATPDRQAGAHRQPLADHDRGPASAAPPSTTNSAGPTCLGYFRVLRAGLWPVSAARLPQAHHDRRRAGHHPRTPGQTQEDPVPCRHAAGATRRPRHAHRHGRRRRQLHGRRQ